MFKVKIYVIHTQFLSHRKQMCDAFVEKLKSTNGLDISVEFYTKFDPEASSAQLIQGMINLVKTEKVELYDKLLKNMHIKQASNVVKHYSALQEASKSTESFDYVMIVEDDVMFGDDVGHKLVQAIQKMSSADCDILFLGLPSLVPIVENTLKIQPVKDMFKILPCCDSYIIKSSAVQKLEAAYAPIRFSTNLQLSYIFETNDFNVQMTVPNILLDGSKFGLYLSSLEANNKLFLNPEYNQLNSIVRKDVCSVEDVAAAKKLLETMKFKNHPDIMFLAGMFEIKLGNYEKAKSVFEAIHNIYNQNHSIINNESEFLQVYMNLYKHLQT